MLVFFYLLISNWVFPRSSHSKFEICETRIFRRFNMPVPTSTLIKTEEEERAIRLAEQQQVWERQRLEFEERRKQQSQKN